MKNVLTKEYFLKNKDKIVKATAIVAVIAVALCVFFFGSKEKGEDIKIDKNEEIVVTDEEVEVIADVSGAVVNPKVVELKANSRVEDAIDAAGGLANNADLSNINRAAIVEDGDKIYIPTKNQVDEEASKEQAGDGKININTATTSELQQITGVGPATAEKILLYRVTNGSFSKIEDIKEIDGIGDKTYEKIKEQVKI